jgi:outer membrane receptor for ferrienterochelin and colicins
VSRGQWRAGSGLLAAVAALHALAAPARAQQPDLAALELEDLLRVNVVTASKVEERVKDAPGVMVVVTRDEIEAFGATSLVDVLNRVTSFHLMSSHLWVQAKSVLRGNLITHADHHILVLINGRPFRDARESNSNWALYTAFPVGLVERIEVIRGPGSVLYGSNAVSGVINIITKKPVERRAELQASGGAFGTGAAAAEAELKGQDWSLLMGGSYYDEDGWRYAAATNFPSPAVGVRRAEKDFGEHHKTFSAFFEYRRFTAQVMHLDVTYDTMGTLPHWTSAGEVWGARSFVDLSYAQPLRGSWNLKMSLSLNDLRQSIRDQTLPALSDGQENALATVLEVAARGKLGEKTNLVLGGLTERRANYDLAPVTAAFAPAIPAEYSEMHYSTYLQADHKLRDWLKLVGGAQYNHTASGHDGLVPRLGAVAPLSDSVTVKALWGRAFRTATPLEEYIDTSAIIGRGDLEPEEVSTFDLQAFLDRPRSQTTLTYFHAKYTGVVERVPAVGRAPALTFRNAGVNTIQGLELEHKSRLVKGVFLTGSVTLQDDKDEKLFVPDYMAKAGIYYSGRSLNGGLFHSRFGKPREGTPLGGLQLNGRPEAIDLLSLNVSYTLRLRVPVTASVYASNLLDDEMNYTEFARGWTNSLPIGPGRAVYGKVRVEF